MRQVEALELIDRQGGETWMGMMNRGSYTVSASDRVIPFMVWNRLIEKGWLDIRSKERGAMSNNRHLYITAEGYRLLKDEDDV